MQQAAGEGVDNVCAVMGAGPSNSPTPRPRTAHTRTCTGLLNALAVAQPPQLAELGQQEALQLAPLLAVADVVQHLPRDCCVCGMGVGMAGHRVESADGGRRMAASRVQRPQATRAHLC